ncbi:MAG: hypothetical protein ACON5N_03805 [Akkermansiaceae bacterium]
MNNYLTTIRKKILCLALSLTATTSAIELVPPEGGFLNEDHKQRYDHCRNQLQSFDEKYAQEKSSLDGALREALETRLLELAFTAQPERIRELQKITSTWFEAEGAVNIGEEIPEEVAVEVATYRKSIARRSQAKDYSKAKEYHWLVRQLDKLALTFEKEGNLDSMRTLRKEARALMPTMGLKPKMYGPLQLTAYSWYYGHLPFIRMQRIEGEQELISLSRLNGNFAGGGEWIEIQVWDEGGLPGLHAHSMQKNVRADAFAIRHPGLNLDKAKVRTQTITFNSQGHRVKLIHQSRGFCYLGGMSGNVGELTSAEVSLDPEDGFYYLSGRFESRSTAFRAVIVKYPEGETPELKISHAEWKRGDPVQELIKAGDGICVLSGVSGAFRGQGEEVRLFVDAKGRWRLGGRSNLINTGAKAMVIRLKN